MNFEKPKIEFNREVEKDKSLNGKERKQKQENDKEEEFLSDINIVGAKSEEEKRVLMEKIKKAALEEEKKLREIELEKTPEELEMIEFANQAVNKVLERYGLSPKRLPPEKIHILSKEEYQKLFGDKSLGKHFVVTGDIVLKKLPIDLRLVAVLTHEMLHHRSYQSVRIWPFPDKEGNFPAVPYRSGLGLYSEKKQKDYFNAINEAVIEEINKKVIEEIISQPPSLIKKEIDDLKKIRESFRDGFLPLVVKGRIKKFSLKDLFYFKTLKELDKDIRVRIGSFAYGKERRVLNKLVDELYQRNKDKFKNKEEVFGLFVKAVFQGKMIELGKLIERTFGKGSLRVLAEKGKLLSKPRRFFIGLIKKLKIGNLIKRFNKNQFQF